MERMKVGEGKRLFRNITHIHHNISSTNFRKCRGLDISCGFTFTNKRDFTLKLTKKFGTIF